jgi:predicted transcriptional regulator
MGHKRYRDQILCKILEICEGNGASKTQIVYNCNLNFHTVVPYLELLIRNDLAERVEGATTRYRATEKGTKALQCLKDIEEMIPDFKTSL